MLIKILRVRKEKIEKTCSRERHRSQKKCGTKNEASEVKKRAGDPASTGRACPPREGGLVTEN